MMSSSQAPSALPLHDLTPLSSRRPSPAPPGRPNTKASSITSRYSKLSPYETAANLNTSLIQGLSQQDASTRLLDYGPNELPTEEPEPMWLRFVKQFKETLILLLLASAGISFVMGNMDDAVSIGLAVTIVVTVGFIQEYRSEKSLEALNKLVPHYANVVRDHRPDQPLRSGKQEGDGRLNGQPSPAMSNGHAPVGTPGPARVSSTIAASQVVAGDLIQFSTGDRIPADVRITSAADLSIDESNLTGENEPVAKQCEALRKLEPGKTQFVSGIPISPAYASPSTGTVGADMRLNEQTNIAFMGTLVRSGYGEGIVIATGAQTEFGAISASLQEIESPRTPLQQSMDRLGQELSYMSFGVIGLIVVIGLIQGMALLEMFTIGVSLAVAAIPEGLPIIVTVTLALGVLRMAKRGAIVRRLPSVETLGSVNVVCSDKTGTLTLNHMTVTKLWHMDAGSDTIEIGKDMTRSEPDPATRAIVRIGNIANNSRLTKDQEATAASSVAILTSTQGDSNSRPKSRWVGQPTDVAMLDLVDAYGEDDVRERLGDRAAETPFSSERKWMGVAIGGRESQTAYIKGALEQVLKRCDMYLNKDGREVVLDEARRKEAFAAAERMAEEGLRVLGFATGAISKSRSSQPSSRVATPGPSSDRLTPSLPSSNDELFQGLTFAGIVGMNDPPRKGVDKSIKKLLKGGVKVIMITGDAETTALAIAKKIGMPINMPTSSRSDPSSTTYGPVIRGDQLDQMSKADLSAAMSGVSIFARTSPEHKMKIIRALQARGDVVAMTGDGVNDAPALKKADIGISMGMLGTDVAKEAADMILTDDDFSTILKAIEAGKGIFYNIQNFITFQLSTSVAALSLVLISTTLHFKNPLNAMQILWINILMDGPPAQSLGVEPVDPAIMNRPPRSRDERVLTRPLIRRVLTSASLIMLGTLLVYAREMGVDGKVTARDTTMTFTCFVFFDMFNALTCRSEGKSLLKGEMKLTGNKMFNYAVGGSLIGQMLVVYAPPLQGIFQTEALYFSDLIALALIASSVFWVDEARKFYQQRQRRMLGPSVGYSANV